MYCNMKRSKMSQVNKFVLGNKELEGKTAEFQYDRGWYSIVDIIGEEKNIVFFKKMILPKVPFSPR